LDYHGCSCQQLNLPHEETSRADKGMLAWNAEASRANVNFHEQWRFRHVGSFSLPGVVLNSGRTFRHEQTSLEATSWLRHPFSRRQGQQAYESLGQALRLLEFDSKSPFLQF